MFLISPKFEAHSSCKIALIKNTCKLEAKPYQKYSINTILTYTVSLCLEMELMKCMFGPTSQCSLRHPALHGVSVTALRSLRWHLSHKGMIRPRSTRTTPAISTHQRPFPPFFPICFLIHVLHCNAIIYIFLSTMIRFGLGQMQLLIHVLHWIIKLS